MPILGRARPADRWVLESLLGGTWKILCCGLFRGVLMGFRGLQSRKNGWPEGCLWTWGSKKFGEREVFSSVRKTALHGVKKLCGLVDKILLHFRYVGVVSYIILKMVLWVCNLWKPKTWFRLWKKWYCCVQGSAVYLFWWILHYVPGCDISDPGGKIRKI